MSEPTYRIELTHEPENGSAVCWHAQVFLIADDQYAAMDAFRATREDALDGAQAWCKAKASAPEHPSTVLLTEDGELYEGLHAVTP